MKTVFGITANEARDAARMGIQSAVAAAAMFSLMQWLSLPEKFVGILSAVLVVQPNLGNTVMQARDRFVATIVGSAIGVACLFVLPSGYGTAAALAVSMLLLNSIASFRPAWRYGVVAAVALSLGSDSDIVQTTIDRGLAIGIGAILGTLVSLIVWPESATKRANRQMSLALKATAQRHDMAVSRVENEAEDEASEARRSFHSHLEQARSAAEGILFGEEKEVRSRIDKIEKLYNSVLFLNRAAEEMSDSSSSVDDIRDHVDIIQDESLDVIRALADGEKTGHGSKLEKIRDALLEARNTVADDNDNSTDFIFRSAYVFALGEVWDSLDELAEEEEKDVDD